MKKRILAMLLCIVMCASLVSVTAFADNEPVAYIGETGYATLSEAINAAEDGATITLGAGSYTTYGLASPKKSLTFVGAGADNTVWGIGAKTPNPALEGTEYNSDYSFQGCGSVTFKNMTLNCGTKVYLGFTHVENIVVENCVVNGFTTYWGTVSTKFLNTTFNAPEGEYVMWDYGCPEMTFDGCTFNVSGKVINAYTESSNNTFVINYNNCTVNSTKANKSVLNIRDNNNNWIVNITGTNVVEGLNSNSVTCSKLYQVENKGNSTKTTVSIDGEVVWDNHAMVSHKHTEGTMSKVVGEDGLTYMQCDTCGYKYEYVEPAAQIGDVTYKTLPEALRAATEGDTVVLLKDVVTTSVIVSSKNITLDMNGHNITGDSTWATLAVINGKLELVGTGTISTVNAPSAANYVVLIGNFPKDPTPEVKPTLVVGENVTIESDCCFGIALMGKTGTQTLIVNGTVKNLATGEKAGYAISGNGTAGYADTNITVNGYVYSAEEYAIYQPQAGNLTINGVVEGNGGISARAGKTVINSTATIKAVGNGTTTSGDSKVQVPVAALMFDTTSNYPQMTEDSGISVEGGTIDGAVATVGEESRIVVTGGSFDIDPSNYVASGYTVNNSNGRYIVSRSISSIGGGSAAPSNNNSQEEEVPEEDVPLAGVPSFKDVTEANWYYDDVVYMYMNNLMNGITEEAFEPTLTTTRGMIVTILYRMEGSPEVTGECPFADVNAGSYYEKAITWAAANKIVLGFTADKYAPDQDITREQMAAILYRYASFKGLDVSELADISTFVDASNISAYAVDAIRWANACKLVTGTSETTLDPTGNAQRCQVAAMFHRFAEMMKSEVSE